MTAPTDADEVTVINADGWLGHIAQLALLLSKTKPGDVIADAQGEPADPERTATLVGVSFWAQNAEVLDDALADISGGGGWTEPGPGLGPGAAEGRPERLTVAVEEAAVILGIIRAFAYKLVKDGVIPSRRLGGRVLVPRKALEKLLDVDSQQSAID